MVRPTLRKRAFKALKEGWKQGFGQRHSVAVEAKEVSRPTLAAGADEGSVVDLVDGKLRSGSMPEGLRETWGMEDGNSGSV